MATAPQMAPQQALPTGQANSLAANIASLLQTFGGTQTTATSNPGDIAALQATLGQLQGADYNAMLQSIFQQAGGQIPGLQAGLSNAVGARSGGNSAVAAALQKLLQQTTIAGQEQIAKQQLANQQTQVQAGNAIAQATKGTQQTQQQGTNLKQGAGNLATAAALTQLLGSGLKLTGNATLQDAINKVIGTSVAAPAGQLANPFIGDVGAGMPATYTGAPTPQMSMAPDMTTGINMNQVLGRPISTPADAGMAPDGLPSYTGTPQSSPAPADFFTPSLDINSILGNTPAAPEMSAAPADWFEQTFNINDYLA